MTYDCDVLLMDTNGPPGGFAPLHNASKPTGGTEIHLTQLAEAFARAGFSTLAVSDIPKAEQHGARYVPRRETSRLRCRALISCGVGPLPIGVTTDRAVVLFTHAIGRNVPHIQHLRYSDIICVSKWQASEAPFAWRVHPIRPIIDDVIYDLPKVEKDPNKFVCFSAWWKGGAETLVVWEQIQRKPGQTLYVGSPYSQGTDLQARVERVPGCIYVPLENPRAVVEAMRDAAGVFRVSTTPETFGVTDAIAQLLGCRIHHWACGGVGGANEALGGEYVTADRAEFTRDFVTPSVSHGTDLDRAARMPNMRADVVIKEWIRIMRLE